MDFLLKIDFWVSPQTYWIRLLKGRIGKQVILTSDKVDLAIDLYFPNVSVHKNYPGCFLKTPISSSTPHLAILIQRDQAGA